MSTGLSSGLLRIQYPRSSGLYFLYETQPHDARSFQESSRQTSTDRADAMVTFPLFSIDHLPWIREQAFQSKNNAAYLEHMPGNGPDVVLYLVSSTFFELQNNSTKVEIIRL